MTLKQHTQHSPKVYLPDGPFSKEQCLMRVTYLNHLKTPSRDQLIPALVGREVSDAKRQILALPLRHGGLGLTDPRETAKMEYEHSTQITNKLTKSTLKSSISTTTQKHP